MADSNLNDGAREYRQTAPTFAARLTGHRSLSPRGFRWLMLFVALVCGAVGTLFWAIGAWPVIGFLGLDILIVWLAFRCNYRAARACEEIAVWPHDLLVRQVSPSGRVAEHRFNPFWTRFVVSRHELAGITRMGLRAGGRDLPIGACLNPADRETFARALGNALASVRRR